MQRILPLICLAFLTWACAETKTAASDSAAETETPSEASENKTDILFDGSSLDAWRTYGAESDTGWIIEDGNIKTPGGTGDLITKATYSSFDFELEWKISPGGNSGVFFHVVDDPDTYQAVYHTGPEYQLIDNEGYGELDSVNMTAANYDMQIAHGAAPNPPGEWNTTRIKVEGDAVTHYLNGEEVLSYVLGSDAWKAQLANSKWKDYPGYAMSREGHLALQDHGDPVWFRNIKVTRLD